MNDTPMGRRLPDGARLVVLVNPAARSTGDRAAIEQAADVLRGRYAVDIVAPVTATDLAMAARRAAETHDAVVVAGGDGTLHHVINALSGVAIPLGMLPLGTGNDFARSLNIPASPAQAARVLLEGRVRAIDLVDVGGRLCCTVAVIGLAAAATVAYNRLLRQGSWTRPLMKEIGGWAYRLAGLLVMIRPGTLVDRVVIDVDGSTDDLSARGVHGVFITNGTMLGSGMTLPVESRLDDGRLEVVWVNAMSRPRLLWAFACLANGWRIPEGVVASRRGVRAGITIDRAVTLAADGEELAYGMRVDASVRPGALHVIVPPDELN